MPQQKPAPYKKISKTKAIFYQKNRKNDQKGLYKFLNILKIWKSKSNFVVKCLVTFLHIKSFSLY